MSKTRIRSQKRGGVALGQRRANSAWNSVDEATRRFGTNTTAIGDYAGEAKKLPVRIKASGLGQALAFVNSKAKKSQKDTDALTQLLADLSEWVLHGRELAVTWTPGEPAEQGKPQPACPNDLLQAIVHGKTSFMRWATDEVLAWLQWLNRFLEAEVKIDPTKEFSDGDA